MKYVRRLVLAASILVLPLIIGVGVAHAQTFKHGDSVTLPAQSKVDGSYYAAGRLITVAGEVDGDVYCFGQTIMVSGTVHGDVICAGQTIDVSGTVDGSVRVAGQTVTVQGKVDHSASLAGQTLTIGPNGEIAQDASAAGQSVTINGKIGRDLALGGEDTYVNNEIGRDIRARTENLILGENASARNIEYTSQKLAIISEEADVSGKVTHHSPPPKETKKHAFNYGFGIAAALFIIVMLLFTSLVLVLLFPSAFAATSEYGLQSPGKTVLIGLASGFVVPVLIIGLFATVIGLPLGIILGLGWLLILIMSGPVFAFYVGRLILSRGTNPMTIILVGSLPVLVLCFVPFIGQLLMLVAGIMGVGMMVQVAMHRVPHPHRLLTPVPSKSSKSELTVSTKVVEDIPEKPEKPVKPEKSSKTKKSTKKS